MGGVAVPIRLSFQTDAGSDFPGATEEAIPLNCLVTGAAGFIGSHLCERLLVLGHNVLGLDSFTSYYARSQKESNLAVARSHKRFTFVERDLASDDLDRLPKNIDIVFHLAAQPGVRGSWGAGFESYVRMNITATQRLLESVKGRPLNKFIYASSSSVYGDAESLPTPEKALPRPISPYGVTKLAGEHLADLYARNYGLPVIAVRYFTVYGPRQRPDMAFHRFICALLRDRAIELYGDGEQTRDYTYIDDAIDGTIRAAFSDIRGEVFNIGGGSQATVNRVIELLRELSGRNVSVQTQPIRRGDAGHTCADTERARNRLGYEPKTDLTSGLSSELDWLRAQNFLA